VFKCGHGHLNVGFLLSEVDKGFSTKLVVVLVNKLDGNTTGSRGAWGVLCIPGGHGECSAFQGGMGSALHSKVQPEVTYPKKQLPTDKGATGVLCIPKFRFYCISGMQCYEPTSCMCMEFLAVYTN